MEITPASLKEKSGVGFGTSGIRATVENLTDYVVWAYTKAFIEFLKQKNDLAGGKIAIAGDLRDSTKRIMETVASAISDSGLGVVNCGQIPTPAVVYYGSVMKMPTVMITGSHIPTDRNGIKYHLSSREIIKKEEIIIAEIRVMVDDKLFDEKGGLLREKKKELPRVTDEARQLYIKRYIDFFPKDIVSGKKLGLYGHSAVGREIVEEILKSLGAKVFRLAFSESFVPVDTEAVDEKLMTKGKEWDGEYDLDAIISTDGDGDRPLMADENGNWVRSDILGILTADYLGADAVVVTVSCNTALEKSKLVDKIDRVRIGSPYVVEGMMKLADEGHKTVVGYEANGGFLINSLIKLGERSLDRLMTRDALVVLLSVLTLSVNKKQELSELIRDLPPRFTASSSVKDFPTGLSLEILDGLSSGTFEDQKRKIVKALGTDLAPVKDINTIDGLRLTLENGEIIHFRPSSNSPEFRNYTEADSAQRAEQLSKIAREIISSWLE